MSDTHLQTKGHTWDRCLSRALINTGVGFGFGVLFSVVLFRRKMWPLSMGTGFGAGMGYAQCQFDFLHPDIIHGRIMTADKFLEKHNKQQQQEAAEAASSETA